MEGSDVELGAAMADQPSLRQACDEEQPDVVLSDIRMPPTRTDEVAAQRRRSIERSSCSTAARSRRPSLTRSRPRRSRSAQRS
jgi:CheY-like chemotaxis protein